MGMAGGGFGDQFNGIDKVVCPAGAAQSGSGYQFTCKPGEPLDFFRLISQETGTFAFAYKFFNWRTAPTPASYCNGCDPQNMSVINWAGYLAWVVGFVIGILPLISATPDSIKMYDQPAALYSMIAGFIVYMVIAKLGGEPKVVAMPPAMARAK